MGSELRRGKEEEAEVGTKSKIVIDI